MNFSGKKKQKTVEPKITYKQTPHAIDLHARAILPQDDNLNFIHPLTAHLPTKGLQREKLILDAMSRQLKKPLPPVGYIFIIGIVVILGGVIFYDAVYKDYDQAQKDYDFKLRTNNLTSSDEAPRLFNFDLKSLPGIKG